MPGRFLERASLALAASLDLAAVVDAILALLVPDCGDWCVIDLITADFAAVERVGIRHRDAEAEQRLREMSARHPPVLGKPTLGRRARDTGRAQLFPHVSRAVLEGAGFPREQIEGIESLGPQSAMVAPLRARDRVFGVIALFRGERYEERDVGEFEEFGRRAAIAIDNARLYDAERTARTTAELAERRLAFLADAGAALSESLDYEATLRTASALAVPVLGDYCVVDIVDEQGEIRRLSEAHVDPARLPLLRESARFITGALSADHPLRVALSRTEPLVVQPITPEWVAHAAPIPEHRALVMRLAPRAILQVAMRSRDGTPLGIISFARSESARMYTEADLALAADFGLRAASAIDNARLHASTERSRAAAEAASLAKTEFLRTVSHELRSPLNAVLGHQELLALELHGPITPAQADALRRIRASAQHLTTLIDDLLNFARIEAGQLEYALGPVNLNELLARMEGFVGPQAASKHLTFRYATDARPILVLADSDRVQQILINLLTNAIKFTRPGGRIAIEADRSHRAPVARVRVRDTGIGIARERHEDIFAPFVQVEQKLTRSQEGLGLGLAISRDLARGMHGDLTVDSAPGTGSVFTLTLPLAPADEASVRREA